MDDKTAQPELQFFADPAIDRLLGVVFNLAGEVQVLRDRMQLLEALLAQQDLITPGAVDAFVPGTPLQARLDADRAAYVKHLFDPMLGLAASRSVSGVTGVL
jgi:hypothetical protein